MHSALRGPLSPFSFFLGGLGFRDPPRVGARGMGRSVGRDQVGVVQSPIPGPPVKNRLQGFTWAVGDEGIMQ